jgi:glycosyltransferase involved in cell wall biosynthesis
VKLIIQIPCYNEEKTIGRTLADLPKSVEGITAIETLIIDDGSSDRTIEAARAAGVTHVVRLLNHRGLSTAFVAGINAALRLGADVIVNTDADNQYRGEDVARLAAPIIQGNAEVVIGDRDIRNSAHMGGFKKFLQRLGSRAVGLASGMTVPDVTSGFRAFSREAAYQINVFNPFTYTLETVIQAGIRNLPLQSVVVRTNAPTRPSRLYRSMRSYVGKSAVTIFRIYSLYRPLKTFFTIGAALLLVGIALGARFVYYYIDGGGSGHIQSLILAAILSIVGFQTMLIGLLADLISVNRRLSEEVLIRLKKLERGPRRAREPRRHRGERPQQAQAVLVEPENEPETHWVWLLDEAKLDQMGPEAEEISPPAGEQPRKRRRRRGGRGFAGQRSPRERLPHGHLKGGGEPPVPPVEDK